MKRNLSHISIPFPPRLMSTSRNAVNMPFEFAREVRNMISNLSGAGQKRNGFVKFGTAILGENIITLIPFTGANGSQTLAFCSSGNLYVTKNKGQTWENLNVNLSSNGCLRWAHFAGKLILCNGVDNVLSWNGETLTELGQWILEDSETLAYVNATTFSVNVFLNDYAIGQRLRIDDIETTITSITEEDDTLTISVADSVLNESFSKLERFMKPPKFNYVYAAHDRLWGMGKGAISKNFSTDNNDRSFVFYTYAVNDESKWFDDVGALQYIDLSNKSSVMDEVLGMAVKDNFTLFFMRNHIQIWAGYNPTLEGDMAWQKTIPIGLTHGNLIAKLPNDIAFFTRYGVRTLSRILQTEQLDVSDLGSEIDPTLSAALERIYNNESHYLNHVHAFSYGNQGWYGFHIAGESYIFQMGSVSQGWSIFDGLFENLTAICTHLDGGLLLASGGQVYAYSKNVFHDDNAPIKTRWWTPWINGSVKGRWANKYTEIVAEQGKSIPLTIKRFKNYNNASFVENYTQVQKYPDYWNEATWDESFWDYYDPSPANSRDPYIADTFAYMVESDSTEGPLTLYGMKLHGVKEK